MIDSTLLNECRALVESRRGELIAVCQQLVQTPSLSGQEGPVAELLLDAMRGLDYDESWMDAAGNVVGIVRGQGGPVTMLNGHMDIVDPGDPAGWPHPPYSGALHEGHLWGRGSADMKSSLAGMVYAAGLFKAWGRRGVRRRAGGVGRLGQPPTAQRRPGAGRARRGGRADRQPVIPGPSRADHPAGTAQGPLDARQRGGL
jgi:hypothetical protein